MSSAESSATNARSRQSATWFCHECNREGVPLRAPDPQCRFCRSSFVEEIESENLGNNLRMWHMGVDSAAQDYSPPIPGTRQRYDQQEREREQESQSGMGNVLDPIFNIFGIQNVPNPTSSQNNPSTAPQRGFQTFSRYEIHRSSSNSDPNDTSTTNRGVNLSDFLRFGTMGSGTNVNDNSTESSTESGRGSTQTNQRGSSERMDVGSAPEDDSPPLPGRLASGLYTFAFDSRAPTPVFGFQPSAALNSDNQPSQPNNGSRFENHQGFRTSQDEGTRSTNVAPTLQGFFSLLQSALGNATPAHPPASENRPDETRIPQTPAAPQDSTSSFPGRSFSPEENDSSQPSGAQSDDGSHFHPRPNSDTPGVNLDEGHPLRHFFNLINSLNPQEATNREGGFNGFILNGGTGFGFAANIGSGTAVPTHLGDYVFGETAMQDILNQLMNIAGANTGYDQVPASEAQIKSMRQFKYSPDPTGELNECAICKDDFAAEDECMELPCKHYFHTEDCIKPWLKQSGTCPVCRYSLVDESEANRPLESSPRNSQEAESNLRSSSPLLQPEVNSSSGASNSTPNSGASNRSNSFSHYNHVANSELPPDFDVD
ncbi:hypothetical protein BY996DRAFT_6408267 [Phakopsora pachyrhizi]|nr:hypothetical protein BY996DRAFT_6408267 [Phakopsora pachyrhizi]